MSDDPRVAVICDEMDWTDERGPHYASIILAALDAHAAEVLAEAREGCVPVRVAVAVAPDKQYLAYGSDEASPEDNTRETCWTAGVRLSFITAWAPLPEPAVPAEIAGEVEPCP